MAHRHSHDQDHHPNGPAAGGSRGRLAIALALTVAMLAVEAVGGWWSGSLALLADAAHMLVDAGALGLAWGAAVFAAKPADARRSFGYARLEVLAGFANALVQVLLVAWIVYEAIVRLLDLGNIQIQSGTMLAVAVIGLVVNAAVLRSLHDGHHENLNTAGARLHVLGDLLGSFGTVVAALLVRYLGWEWADPALSLLVSLLILRGAFVLLRRSSHILLEGVPEGLEPERIRAALQASDPAIVGIHHLHVWQIASGSRMATLHARLCENADSRRALLAIQRTARERFAVSHVTVQIESSECLDTVAGCADPQHGGIRQDDHP